MMKNNHIQLVSADVSFAEQVIDYYKRNKEFLKEFEPVRNEEFFSLEYQRKVLKEEMLEYKKKDSISLLYYVNGTAFKNYRYNWIE